MKKKTVILIVVLVISATIYGIVYFVAIPETAAFIVPDKWKNIVAGQKMESYYQYLGKPSADSVSGEMKINTWYARSNNYQFYLNIHFKADSVAAAYDMHYGFSNWLFGKTGIIKAGNAEDDTQ
ncbi:MAG TPA: hypothetical protein PLA68_00070 [Panacibacter sp.]|nr:hypothetical protein [Panacibacter sp.]